MTANSQLSVLRHPLPLPEERMRKLGGGYGFTKINLADAYNKVRFCPEPQAFGSQYAQTCIVTKCSSIWNFISFRLLPEDRGRPQF